VQYTSSELALKIAPAGTSHTSIFQLAIKTLFGFHTYLLSSYNSSIVPFLPRKLYTINNKSPQKIVSFVASLGLVGYFYATIEPHFPLLILQVNKHGLNHMKGKMKKLKSHFILSFINVSIT